MGRSLPGFVCEVRRAVGHLRHLDADPDQSLYPVYSVPQVVRRINQALAARLAADTTALARDYRNRGMSAYSDLQQVEFAAEGQGYGATRHLGYFDQWRRSSPEDSVDSGHSGVHGDDS